MITNPNPPVAQTILSASERRADLQRNLGRILATTLDAHNCTASLPNDAYVEISRRLDAIRRETKLALVYLSNLEAQS